MYLENPVVLLEEADAAWAHAYGIIENNITYYDFCIFFTFE